VKISTPTGEIVRDPSGDPRQTLGEKRLSGTLPIVRLEQLLQFVALGRLEEVESAWREAGLPEAVMTAGQVSPVGAWSSETEPVTLRIETVPSELVWSLSAPDDSAAGVRVDALVAEMRAKPPSGSDAEAWVRDLRAEATRTLGEPTASLVAAGTSAWTFRWHSLEARLIEASGNEPPVLRVRRRAIVRR
jgi:hypothetical protein